MITTDLLLYCLPVASGVPASSCAGHQPSGCFSESLLSRRQTLAEQAEQLQRLRHRQPRRGCRRASRRWTTDRCVACGACRASQDLCLSHLTSSAGRWRGYSTRASQVLGFGADLGPDHPVRWQALARFCTWMARGAELVAVYPSGLSRRLVQAAPRGHSQPGKAAQSVRGASTTLSVPLCGWVPSCCLTLCASLVHTQVHGRQILSNIPRVAGASLSQR